MGTLIYMDSIKTRKGIVRGAWKGEARDSDSVVIVCPLRTGEERPWVNPKRVAGVAGLKTDRQRVKAMQERDHRLKG